MQTVLRERYSIKRTGNCNDNIWGGEVVSWMRQPAMIQVKVDAKASSSVSTPISESIVTRKDNFLISTVGLALLYLVKRLACNSKFAGSIFGVHKCAAEELDASGFSGYHGKTPTRPKKYHQNQQNHKY